MNVAVREGDVIAGKYRVERVLGKGAMGVVVAATHLRLEQRVAIKVMSGDLFERPEMMARFGREARAVAKIKSEHVARVLDVGELDEGGAPYIVMEYLEGQDLAALLSSRGPLPGAEAVGYVLEACEALAEAHARGLVHRDLKPENLYLAARPGGSSLVKVLDFGISKEPSEPTEKGGLRLTAKAAVMGSPLYMPPEQLRSARDVDPRSDIWSLGVILYELLSGRTPFGGDDLTELVTDVMTNPPPPLRRPDLPPGLEAVIGGCLRRDRAERFADIASLAMALAPFGPAEARASAERVGRVLHGSLRPSVEPPQRASRSPLASSETSPTSRSLFALPITPPAHDAVRTRRMVTALLAAFIAIAAGVIGGGTLALRRNASGALPALPSGVRSDLTAARPANAASPPAEVRATPPASMAPPAAASGEVPAGPLASPHEPGREAGAESTTQLPPKVGGATPRPQQAQATAQPQQAQATTQPQQAQATAQPQQAQATTQPPHATATQPPHATATQPPHATATQPPQAQATPSHGRPPATADAAPTRPPIAPTANPFDMPIK